MASLADLKRCAKLDQRLVILW